MYTIGGIGTSMGYHRILTHRSAEMSKWFEHLLVLIGLPAGTPIQWAGNHRAHHKHTDEEGDPHSPHISGFWYAHCGWYIGTKNPLICFLYAVAGPFRILIDSVIRPRTNQEHVNMAPDVAKDNFYKTISRPLVYMFIMWTYLFMVLSVPYFIFGSSGIIAASITLIVIYNLGDAVDSIGHLFGERKDTSQARNNIVLGIFAFGDGWHSNHHRFPRKGRHGQNNQLDMSYLMMLALKKIGLIKKIY